MVAEDAFRPTRRVKTTFAEPRKCACPPPSMSTQDAATSAEPMAEPSPTAAHRGMEAMPSPKKNTTYDAEGKTDTLTALISKGVPDFPKEDYIVCRKDDAPGFVTADVYGGEVGVAMRTYVCGEGGVRMMCTVPTGHVEPPHFHSGQYEWLVLSGVFKVRNPCTGREHILREGDYYCNPGGVPHTEEVIEAGCILWIYDQVPDCHCLTDAMQAQLKEPVTNEPATPKGKHVETDFVADTMPRQHVATEPMAEPSPKKSVDATIWPVNNEPEPSPKKSADDATFDAEGRTAALTALISKGVPDFPREDYIVCRKDDAPGFVTADVYGGEGGVAMRTYVYGEGGVRMLVYLPTGHVELPHFHSGQYEWLVLSGVHKVRNPCTGREHILREGDYYCNPGGVPHTEEVIEAGHVFWIYHEVPDCHCLTEAMLAQLSLES